MKEFRPRLTDQMLQVLCEAIGSEASRLAYVYDEKKREAHKLAHKLMEHEPIHFDKDPEYQKLCYEREEARRKVQLLEDVEFQFKRLLKNQTKGRRVVRRWNSRIFDIQLRNAR